MYRYICAYKPCIKLRRRQKISTYDQMLEAFAAEKSFFVKETPGCEGRLRLRFISLRQSEDVCDTKYASDFEQFVVRLAAILFFTPASDSHMTNKRSNHVYRVPYAKVCNS